jgi:hypothetical protein
MIATINTEIAIYFFKKRRGTHYIPMLSSSLREKILPSIQKVFYFSRKGGGGV